MLTCFCFSLSFPLPIVFFNFFFSHPSFRYPSLIHLILLFLFSFLPLPLRLPLLPHSIYISFPFSPFLSAPLFYFLFSSPFIFLYVRPMAPGGPVIDTIPQWRRQVLIVVLSCLAHAVPLSSTWTSLVNSARVRVEKWSSGQLVGSLGPPDYDKSVISYRRAGLELNPSATQHSTIVASCLSMPYPAFSFPSLFVRC